MKQLAIAALVVGVIGLVGGARAADDKADPTGTWKWKTSFGKGGKDFEQVLKLENKGGKLTGTISFGKTETKIEDGTFKDGEVKFAITRERNDQKFTTKYSGKVTGDTIKGQIEGSFNGKDFKRDWEAKREK
jgi:hypothetical protein